MIGVVFKQKHYQHSVHDLKCDQDKGGHHYDHCVQLSIFAGLRDCLHHPPILNNQIDRNDDPSEQISIDHLVEGVRPEINSAQSSGEDEIGPKEEGDDLENPMPSLEKGFIK